MGGVISKDKVVVNVLPAAPATKTNVFKIPCSQESSILVPANADRKGIVIYNHCIYGLYIKLGDGQPASLDNFTMIIPAGLTYEFTLPFVGKIYGVWDHFEPEGMAIITELY